MDTTVVLERLSALGVTITPRPNGNLWLEPASKIPSDVLEMVRQHKSEILAHLRQQLGQDGFVPWVLKEWRRVSIPQWRDILRESIITGDRGRADYARWMLRDILFDPEYEDCV